MLKFDIWRSSAIRTLLGAALLAALTACGGGGSGSAGTPVVGPDTGASSPSSAASAADLVVVLSKSTMTNSGTDSITATVTTIDANRATVGNIPVTVAANAGAVVTASATATDAKGVLTATVTQGSDTSVRPVTLTVTSGALTRAVTFNVVQNTTSTNPQANDLTLTLSATNIDNSGSRTVVATATAVDSNRSALSGIPVQLAVTDTSAFIVTPTTQTDNNGQVTGTVSIGQDRSNRTVTVVATSGTLTRTAAFQITGARFAQASPVPAVAAPGSTGNKVQYKLADVNSNPMVGVPISVSGNGVASATGKTDLNGGYDFTYTAPNAPGTSLAITAVAGGLTSTVTVPISGGGSTGVPNSATPVSKTLNLSADVVTVNTGTTSNQVTVNAFFRDSANAPVPNVRVLFGVTGDNNTGVVGSGNNTVLSDASGAASTTYSPGAVSSPTNGVTVQACWKTSDFAVSDTAANCAAAGGTLMTTTLTIVANPVSISIGTDNTISSGSSGLTYIKRYVVLVVDSAGNPKSDVQITPSLDLGGFGKGKWGFDSLKKAWFRDSTVLVTNPVTNAIVNSTTLLATCPNEDLNRNGVIDTGEDVNGNKQLDPRKSDVAIALTGSTKTNANGVAILQLEYPQSLASWVRYKITVTAAGVLSPPAYYPLGVPVSLPSRAVDGFSQATFAADVESYLSTYLWLPVAADVLASESPSPAFVTSPYGGLSADCKKVN
ncbi:hypothetical protein ACS5PN_20975 [Roseateles sp. NT4]|uniref:hypothetical protein n=1 Tax=Roseateles sp. NT4 TaxID=3453715 RepID=UPI003EF0210F